MKSLIGTKVVLFVGYSFNDSDIKQIFSWSKDIHHGDFQRAYLIESGKEYDSNEVDYYENFGINVLYGLFSLMRILKRMIWNFKSSYYSSNFAGFSSSKSQLSILRR